MTDQTLDVEIFDVRFNSMIPERATLKKHCSGM